MVIAITFIFCLILGRLFFVQVVGSEFYTAIAIDQWTRELPVKAARGEIVDKNGRVLAGNKTAYTVYIRPRSVKNIDKVASVLSELYSLDEAALRDKISSSKNLALTICPSTIKFFEKPT